MPRTYTHAAPRSQAAFDLTASLDRASKTEPHRRPPYDVRESVSVRQRDGLRDWTAYNDGRKPYTNDLIEFEQCIEVIEL